MDLEKKLDVNKKELAGLSQFAFWAGMQGYGVQKKSTEQYTQVCGSCGSFCSGGACTTCTSSLEKGYFKAEQQKSEKKYAPVCSWCSSYSSKEEVKALLE